MVNICMVAGDDWEGLYVDGILNREGTNMDAYDMFEIINTSIVGSATIKYLNNKGLKWLDGCGHYPLLLVNVPEEYIDQ